MAKKPRAAPKLSEPSMTNFYPMPTVDYPFIIVDATGKLWRLDPHNGTFREMTEQS